MRNNKLQKRPIQVAVAAALVGLVAALPAQAAMWELGATTSGEFTFLGTPTKWDPGPNTASFHPFAPPAGPMSPGAASWSVMPTGTLSDAFDPHAGVGTPTLGGIAGSLISGLGAGTELAAYGGMLDVWASVSGFTNLGMVADGGAAFNTPEPGPGNTLFGDIRIGSSPFDMAGGILAHAFQPGTGATFPGTPTIGGDMHLDHGETWIDVVAGGAGGFDFHSVVLHEFGHSLGLGHSDDPTAVMFPFISLNTAKRTLAADDVAGITAIYGPGSSVPDSGSTALLLGAGLLGLAAMRRWIGRS